MKARLIDLALLLAMTLVMLGGYWGFSMIQAHREMDRALLSLIKGQTPPPAEAK